MTNDKGPMTLQVACGMFLRKSLLAVFLFAGFWTWATPVRAQYFHTYSSPLSRQIVSPYAAHPPVTPYINLIGRNPVVNYFGIVRPELESRRIQAQQNQAIQTLTRQVQGAEPKSPDVWTLPKTGHHSYFMNFSHYYPGNK